MRIIVEALAIAWRRSFTVQFGIQMGRAVSFEKCSLNRVALSSCLVVCAMVGALLIAMPAAAKSDADLFGDLNDSFRAAYADAMKEDTSAAGPVIIVGGGRATLLHAGKKVEEVEYLPSQYGIFKTLDHVPLAIFVMLVNHTDSPLSDDKVKELETFKKAISAASTKASRLELSAEALERARNLLAVAGNFVDKVTSSQRVSRAELNSFARQCEPVLMDNAYDAVSIELGGLDKQVMGWKKSMSAAEWDNLHVVVMGGHMARQQEREMQYFQMLLGEREEGRRIVYLEGSSEIDNAMDLLAKHILDASIGDAFFADPMRMHRDVLSDAARRYLQEHMADQAK